MGVDALNSADAKLCLAVNTTKCPAGYTTVESWTPGGMLYDLTLPASTTTVHLELYPHTRYQDYASYDPWGDGPGGVQIWVRDLVPGARVDVGGIPLPSSADRGAFKARGGIVSSDGAIADHRILIDAYQLTNLRSTTTGIGVGSYVEQWNRGGVYTLGWSWPGQYFVYITDTATGVKLGAFLNASPGRMPTLDLGAVCFGLDTCQYLAGRPPTATGNFHPLAPARILDTRTGNGHPGGVAPLTAGDGRSTAPTDAQRAADAASHELKVTGRGGVPATGVSAVVMNVTAVDASDPGYLTVFPKPPRGLRNPRDPNEVWNDQSSFLDAYPTTSNLNFAAGDTVPNLVLARVGAGGQVRMDNYVGTVDVVADVVGWFDDGVGPTSGFVGMAPRRLLDTRTGLGGIGRRFSSGNQRMLRFAGVGGVPATATAAILNVTAVDPTSAGFVTVWPSGQDRPLASTLNTAPGRTRPNLAVVKLGRGGAVSLYDYQDTGGTDLVVDAVGYVDATGHQTTSIDPNRLLDSRTGLDTPARPWASGEARTVQVTGRAGVPVGAAGVIVNLTATLPSAAGFATVWPAGGSRPLASNLDFVAGDNVPNLVFVGLSRSGRLSLYNYGGTTHFVLDVVGFVR
jgi:hypothetical protein